MKVFSGRRLGGVLGALCAAVLAAPTAGEIVVADSAEKLVFDSNWIVRGRPIAAEPVHHSWQDVTFQAVEVLRAPAGAATQPQRLTIRCNHAELAASAGDGEGEDWVLFVHRAAADDDTKWLRGRLTLPQGSYPTHGAIDLNAIGKGVPTHKAQMLTDRDALLKAVTDRIAFEQKHAEHFARTRPGPWITTEAGFDGPAFQAFWSGSRVLILVPPDPEVLERSLRWAMAADLYQRQRAASQLAAFDTAESEAALLKLLHDEHAQPRSDTHGEVIRIDYPVRDAAHAALQHLGALPDDPPPTDREPTMAERYDKPIHIARGYIDEHLLTGKLADQSAMRWPVRAFVDEDEAPEFWCVEVDAATMRTLPDGFPNRIYIRKEDGWITTVRTPDATGAGAATQPVGDRPDRGD